MSIICKNIKIIQNKEIIQDVYEMVLQTDIKELSYGKFINIMVEGKYLRRPISILDIEDGKIKIAYKVVGEGTKILSSYKEGQLIDILYPLGTGFNTVKKEVEDILIIAGGIGVPPLVGWYKYLKSLNKYNIKVILGFKNKDQIIYKDKFDDVEIALDVDHTNIIEYMKKNNYFEKYQNYYTYSCGAMPMLKEISNHFEDGQMLLEERMGCGFGACMGCSRQVDEDKYKRVCVEGPMFYNSEVRYES